MANYFDGSSFLTNEYLLCVPTPLLTLDIKNLFKSHDIYSSIEVEGEGKKRKHPPIKKTIQLDRKYRLDVDHLHLADVGYQ